jgi:hypothetical protein
MDYLKFLLDILRILEDTFFRWFMHFQIKCLRRLCDRRIFSRRLCVYSGTYVLEYTLSSILFSYIQNLGAGIAKFV